MQMAIHVYVSSGASLDRLNALLAGGWRLVSMCQLGDGAALVIIEKPTQ